MRRISLFVIAGVIAIVVFLGLSSFESMTSQSDLESPALALDFDGYSEGINTVLYDSLGAINYTLQAERQVHYNDDRTELDHPLIRLFEDGSSRWNIVANSGKISPFIDANDERAQTIELIGNIEVYSIDGLGNRLQLSTEHLHVNPQSRILETDESVTVVTDSIQLTSIGMTANLIQDEILFKRESRGHYEKPSN